MSKTYFIAGGLGLIGWQLVQKIIKDNDRVIILDKKDNPSKAQVEYIENNKIHLLNFDARESVRIREFINGYHEKEGVIVGLVNLLAFYEDREKQMRPIEEYFDDVWEAAIDVNVNDTYKLTKVLLGYFLDKHIKASFVFTSSIYGILGPDNRIYEGGEYLGSTMRTPAHYAFAKAGVLGFSRLIATEYGDRKIRSNCVTPGGVYSGQNKEFIEKYSYRVPLQRMADAEEVADAIQFLISEKSSYITGQNLVIDGGLSAW